MKYFVDLSTVKTLSLNFKELLWIVKRRDFFSNFGRKTVTVAVSVATTALVHMN